jgi:tetrahydromethanopterin S-methyltransferase subunit F
MSNPIASREYVEAQVEQKRQRNKIRDEAFKYGAIFGGGLGLAAGVILMTVLKA